MSDLLLTRDELQALTGTKQAKRMCDWLTIHGWVFVPPTRRAETPKVSRAYSEARLASVSKAPPRPLTARGLREGNSKVSAHPTHRRRQIPPHTLAVAEPARSECCIQSRVIAW